MGAHTFSTTIAVKGDHKAAYREAVEQAEFDHGHDPYNGTISTTSGVVRVPVERNVRATDKRISDILDNPHNAYGVKKWGPAGAIELPANSAEAKRIKERAGLKGKRGVRVFILFGVAAS